MNGKRSQEWPKLAYGFLKQRGFICVNTTRGAEARFLLEVTLDGFPSQLEDFGSVCIQSADHALNFH